MLSLLTCLTKYLEPAINNKNNGIKIIDRALNSPFINLSENGVFTTGSSSIQPLPSSSELLVTFSLGQSSILSKTMSPSSSSSSDKSLHPSPSKSVSLLDSQSKSPVGHESSSSKMPSLSSSLSSNES